MTDTDAPKVQPKIVITFNEVGSIAYDVEISNTQPVQLEIAGHFLVRWAEAQLNQNLNAQLQAIARSTIVAPAPGLQIPRT